MDSEQKTPELVYDFFVSSTSKSAGTQNEDACVNPEQFHDTRLMIVADGVSKSGPCSKQLLEEIVRDADFLVPEAEAAERPEVGEEETMKQLLTSIVTTAATRVFKESEWASTLDLCFFNERELHLMHVGDTQTYVVLKNGNVVKLTEDHNTSVPEEAKVAMSQLPGDDDDLKRFFIEWKNKYRELYRAIDAKTAEQCREAQQEGREYLQYVHLPLADVEAVVMMSDGAHQRMTFSEIETVLKGKHDAQRTTQELVALARSPRRALEAITQFGSPADMQMFQQHIDDTTIAVVNVSELPQQAQQHTKTYDAQALVDIVTAGLEEILNDYGYQQELSLVDFSNPERMIPFLKWKGSLGNYLLRQRSQRPIKEFKVISRQDEDGEDREVGAVIKGVLVRDGLEIPVAIKIMNDGVTERPICDEERAHNEWKDVSNPNLARLVAAYRHRTGNENFSQYHVLVTEWGGDSLYDLERIVDEKGILQPFMLSARQVHSVVRQVANALNGLSCKHHGKLYRILHRDIEPRNVVVQHGGKHKLDDGTCRLLPLTTGDIDVKLVDFNLGKKFTPGERASQTVRRRSTLLKLMRMTEYKPPEFMRVIKSEYLSWQHLRPTLGACYNERLAHYDQPVPEQLGRTLFETLTEGDEIFSPKTRFQQSDIYSVGVLFYSLLKGKSPFPDSQKNYRGEKHDKNYVDTRVRVSVSDLGYSLQQELDEDDLNMFNEIIVRCLQPDPADRYETPAALVDALNRWPDACTNLKTARRAVTDLEIFDRDRWSNPEGPLYTSTNSIVQQLSRRKEGTP